MSADKSPTDLESMEERLRSRLGWGMVADMHPADYDALEIAIKAEQAQVKFQTSLEFMAIALSAMCVN